MQLTEDLKELFSIVRTLLGAPIRRVELSDEQLCDILKVAIGDYSEVVQNWSIMTNWLTMQGKDKITFQNASDYAYAMSVRQFEWSQKFTYWFSREVGLQQRGPFELKKDFIKIERGKQVYVVPAGREINKVMWLTPSTSKAALFGSYGALDTGIAGGFGQFGNLNPGLGITGFYIGNAFDVALLSTDLKFKNSMLRGDLVYKVTAGPEGTHLIHLMSVPGSPNMLGGVAADDRWGWNKYSNCYLWYTYYDVSGSDDDYMNCMLENKDDVIITPDQVPLSQMRFELFNEPTKNLIRQLLVAESKITVSNIRGYASGKVSIPMGEMTMDYAMLANQGNTEKERVFTNLKERLEMMTPWKQMELQAQMTENLNKNLNNIPLGMYWI